MGQIVDAYGSPLLSTKEQVEQRQKYLGEIASRNGGIAGVTPMLPGRNPVLDDDMFYSEMLGRNDAEITRLVGNAKYANEELGTQYRETTAATSNGGAIALPAGAYNERFMKEVPISELNLPRDVTGIMNLSLRYAEDNYMVSTGIRIKKNFALKDMTLNGSSTAKDHYQQEFDRIKFRRLLNNIFRYYWICGRVVVYWGEERPIQRCTILDPRLIRVQSFLGQPFVFLRPDPRWRAILEGPSVSTEKKFLISQLPEWWIEYILRDHDIPLKPETYALIDNDLSLFPTRGIHTIAGAPLSAAFIELSIQRMLLAGDFSVAWMMKNMIGLVSIGDPEHEQNFQRSDTPELQKLQNAFQRPDYAMWAYVDPTVNIRYITPDPDLLKGDRYIETSAHIQRVLCIPSVFSNNSDGDYGTGALELKYFREEIQFGRTDVVSQLMGQLGPILREGHSRRQAGTQNVTLNFDNDCLMDDRVLMELNFGKYDRGAASLQSLLEDKIQDIETERQRKAAEFEEAKANKWAPAYDISHGFAGPNAPDPKTTGLLKATSTDDGNGGHPITTGNPTKEGGSGGQTPRPSK